MPKLDEKQILASCCALKTVECLDLIPSTNLYARERLLREELSFSLFCAEAQSAGRGRLGRSFHSPAGAGIYMSLVLPVDKIESPERLTVTAGAVLCEVLGRMFPTLSPSIKWVNDIYAGDKKLAGILVEGVFSGGGAPYAIVGIGINCRDGAFAPELSDIATDITAVTGASVNRTELVAALINEIFAALKRDFSDILSIYRAHSYLLGKEITVHPHAAPAYPALAENIDEEGRLIIRLADGTSQTLSSADVSVKKR